MAVRSRRAALALAFIGVDPMRVVAASAPRCWPPCPHDGHLHAYLESSSPAGSPRSPARFEVSASSASRLAAGLPDATRTRGSGCADAPGSRIDIRPIGRLQRTDRTVDDGARSETTTALARQDPRLRRAAVRAARLRRHRPGRGRRRASGSSKSSLFHHFASKAELYAAVVARILDRVEQRLMRALVAGGSPVERLDRWIDASSTCSPSIARTPGCSSGRSSRTTS